MLKKKETLPETPDTPLFIKDLHYNATGELMHENAKEQIMGP